MSNFLLVLDRKYSSDLGHKYFFLKKLATVVKAIKFLFKLFNAIVASFCSGKLVKIPENVTAMQSFIFINNIG